MARLKGNNMLFADHAKILPVGKILAEIYAKLLIKKIAVLKSPPGTGKTTLVPPMLLDAQWQKNKKILVIVPRRLAAKSAAYRVAELLGEQIGKTVGYRTRTETRISSDTRIEFITEGIFTHLLISTPELLNIGTVIFDEFHERHLESDLGLSLVSDIRSALNPDLRILVMSATLETEKFSAVFDDYGICECEGRLFPVKIKYLSERYPQNLNEKMLLGILHALAESTGSILCFLPGMREIRSLYDCLREKFINRKDIVIYKLHGDLSSDEQEAAICPPPPGIRKIVLASSIAETSITIEEITAVVDSGLTRKSVFDPRTGISRLETVRISKASAEQRRGRAGRTAPGICIRAWSEHENATLIDFDRPEILDADLSYLALVLAEWGITQVDELKWLDIPPPAKFAEAKRLLVELDALDESFRITPNGKKMLSLGLSPRLSAMIVKAKKLGLESLACEIAAIISEKDFLRNSHLVPKSCDIRTRLEILYNPNNDMANILFLQNVKKTAEQLKCKIGIRQKKESDMQFANFTGALLSLAFPDRIGKRRFGKEPIYLLASGRSARLDATDPLSHEEFIVVADLDDKDRDAKIFLACPIEEKQIFELHERHIKKVEVIAWNEKNRMVEARGRRVLGNIVFEEYPLESPDQEKLAEALIDGIRKEGFSKLTISKECKNLFARIQFVSKHDNKHDWNEFLCEKLFEKIDDWLKPYLHGMKRIEDLQKIDFHEIIKKLLGRERLDVLDKLAPKKIRVPSGSEIMLDYFSREVPVLSVRVQELFGAREHPCVAQGKVPVLIEILSPSLRPVQTTSDLAGFWKNSYQLVRKDMKGRYPKHFWPDDPMQALPAKSSLKKKSYSSL